MRHAPYLKKIIMSAVFFLVSTHGLAANQAPRILREPVLGLHYERARVKFDLLPPQALAKCETLVDDQYSRSVWYMYGQTSDASGRTFYVTGGYEERLDGQPGHRRFLTEGLGWVLLVDTTTCDPLDPARDVFDQRQFDDTLTPAILKQLAIDVVRRLERAFGGRERLSSELRKQLVDMDALPPELRDAMKAYLNRQIGSDRY
jgi:hypothetical protein